jgi:hypothetical protein
VGPRWIRCGVDDAVRSEDVMSFYYNLEKLQANFITRDGKNHFAEGIHVIEAIMLLCPQLLEGQRMRWATTRVLRGAPYGAVGPRHHSAQTKIIRATLIRGA